jgi:hypothetical protein
MDIVQTLGASEVNYDVHKSLYAMLCCQIQNKLLVNVSGRYYIIDLVFLSLVLRFDRLCVLGVRVLDYKYRGPGFDSRALQKK